MRLYLDDDLAQPLLARLLTKDGHDVRLPSELGMTGSHDAVHFKHAVREGRALLSGNYKDFELARSGCSSTARKLDFEIMALRSANHFSDALDQAWLKRRPITPNPAS
jgi:hypothetical protein